MWQWYPPISFHLTYSFILSHSFPFLILPSSPKRRATHMQQLHMLPTSSSLLCPSSSIFLWLTIGFSWRCLHLLAFLGSTCRCWLNQSSSATFIAHLDQAHIHPYTTAVLALTIATHFLQLPHCSTHPPQPTSPLDTVPSNTSHARQRQVPFVGPDVCNRSAKVGPASEVGA